MSPCLLTLGLLVNIVKHRLQVLRYASKIVCKTFQSRQDACDSKTLPEEKRTILFCLSIRVCLENVLDYKALFVRGGFGCSGKRCSSLLDSKSDTLYEHVPKLDALNFRALPSYSMQYSKSYSVDLTPSTLQHIFNYRLAIEIGNTDTERYCRHETLLLGYCKQIDYALEHIAPRVKDQACIKQIVYSLEHFLRLLD